MWAEKDTFQPIFGKDRHFFRGNSIFLEGGVKFSIFQSKFKVFSRLGIFCRSQNFCIGYEKAKLSNACLKNQYYIQSIDPSILKFWRNSRVSEESRNQRVFSGKNDVVLTCKITCTKAYKSVHPEIFGSVGSDQFNWEIVPYVSWLSNLYKKQICIFASKSTLRRFLKMKLCSAYALSFLFVFLFWVSVQKKHICHLRRDDAKTPLCRCVHGHFILL